MKKLLITLFISSFLITFVNADSSDFINSPNRDGVQNIKNIKLRYCEEVFLRAYMRREFSDIENELCRNIFARKIEAEMEYKYGVLNEREIY